MENSDDSFVVLSVRLYELLEAESYSKSTLREMKFILRTLSNYMETCGIIKYSHEVGKQFVTYCTSELQICSSRISKAKSIVGKLNRLLQGLNGSAALLPDKSKSFDLPKSFTEIIVTYLTHCKDNGNRQKTINYKHWVCGRFLENLKDLGVTEIKETTGEQIQTAFLALEYNIYWHWVGPFLRFLFDRGILKQNYSELIYNRRRSMPLPAVYSPEEIIEIENSFNLSSPSGIRNYAITLLMTRYGIRASDVASLTFGDIDYENERLRFTQQKTDEPWECELLPEVKAALQNYVSNVRLSNKDFSNVFIKLTPPYAPLDNYAINAMINNHFSTCKVDKDGRKGGSRVFRSSIASNMINDGISTEIIRKILGHGTKHALKHYARIDVKSMRSCPIPAIKPTGVFAEILSGKGVLTGV